MARFTRHTSSETIYVQVADRALSSKKCVSLDGHAQNSSHSQNCYSIAACRLKMLLWFEPGGHLRKPSWYIFAFLVKCSVRRFTYKSTIANLDNRLRFGHTFSDVSVASCQETLFSSIGEDPFGTSLNLTCSLEHFGSQ